MGVFERHYIFQQMIPFNKSIALMHTVCTHSWSDLLARQYIFAAGLIARLLVYACLRTALHQAYGKAS